MRKRTVKLLNDSFYELQLRDACDVCLLFATEEKAWLLTCREQQPIISTFLKVQAFCDVTPCRLVNSGVLKDSCVFTLRVKQSKILVGCLTLKMEALRFFEQSVHIYPSKRRNIPQDWDIRQHNCEYLKSPISNFLF
jgi:hypothetical protein